MSKVWQQKWLVDDQSAMHCERLSLRATTAVQASCYSEISLKRCSYINMVAQTFQSVKVLKYLTCVVRNGAQAFTYWHIRWTCACQYVSMPLCPGLEGLWFEPRQNSHISMDTWAGPLTPPPSPRDAARWLPACSDLCLCVSGRARWGRQREVSHYSCANGK